MTRTVSAAHQTALDASTTSETTLWTVIPITLPNLYLTGHDQDIVFGGNTYLAAVGYQTTDLASNATLAVDSAADPEIARQIGQLQGQVAGLQREMTAHRQESRDSTDRLHHRITEGQITLQAKIEENANAIRGLEADRVGAVAVSRFKRMIGYVLLTLSGGAGAEFIRHLRDWFSTSG